MRFAEWIVMRRAEMRLPRLLSVTDNTRVRRLAGGVRIQWRAPCA